jgi:glycosyltransferase involved in cell wall biosynthesis
MHSINKIILLKDMMLISVLIPCYNEKNTIEKLVNKILNLKNLEIEIIIIDNNSNDGTKEILENNLETKVSKIIYNDENHGKGYSIKRGIKTAKGEILLVQDADLEYDPNEYEKLINPIKNGYADVVYGSRYVKNNETKVLFFWHTLANRSLTFLSNMFTNLNLTDMLTCYKVFKSDIIKQIDLKEEGFGFDSEVTAKIAKLKPRVYEVGISYFGRSYAQGKKIRLKDGFILLKCIMKYSLF